MTGKPGHPFQLTNSRTFPYTKYHKSVDYRVKAHSLPTSSWKQTSVLPTCTSHDVNKEKCGGEQCKIFLIKHHMVHNRTLDLLLLPINGSDWGTEWHGATLNCVDNVGSVEESKYSACLHTNKTKK